MECYALLIVVSWLVVLTRFVDEERLQRKPISSAVMAVVLLLGMISIPAGLTYFHDPGPMSLLVGSGIVAIVAVLFAAFKKPPPPRNLLRCRRCDYDLSGNESGVCPECGTPI